jgi:hypothetical protein
MPFVMVDPLLIAVVACISGAVLNTVRGYLGNDDSYSAKKLIGAVIVSTFAGIAIANTIAIDSLSLIGVALIGLTAGFSVDFAVTKAKKVA